jgi:hypothetical protein
METKNMTQDKIWRTALHHSGNLSSNIRPGSG